LQQFYLWHQLLRWRILAESINTDVTMTTGLVFITAIKMRGSKTLLLIGMLFILFSFQAIPEQKSWPEFAESPEYQALSDDEKKAAQQYYYEKFVYPNIQDGQVAAARDRFFREANPLYFWKKFAATGFWSLILAIPASIIMVCFLIQFPTIPIPSKLCLPLAYLVAFLLMFWMLSNVFTGSGASQDEYGTCYDRQGAYEC
jgi:hypothetical protein